MPLLDHQTFVLTDPRRFDGDAYEVAERAVAQLDGTLRVLETMLPPTVLMVRNAELERQIALGGDPDVALYDESIQGQKWSAFRRRVEDMRAELAVLRKVAAYNPKAPVKG